MAEKNFFDLFKAKLNQLKPAETHRNADWGALADKLDTALPVQNDKRRNRALIIPLLLVTALVSSNAAWWNARQTDRAAVAQLREQVELLQKNTAGATAGARAEHVRDTIWRTVYVRIREIAATPAPAFGISNTAAGLTAISAAVYPHLQAAEPNLPLSANSGYGTHGDSCRYLADLTTVSTLLPGFLKTPYTHVLPDKILFPAHTNESVTRRFAPKTRANSIGIGLHAGWLYAISSGLMHEGGGIYGINGKIGLSRHWQLSADFDNGQIHYKAHNPAAVLGVPAEFLANFQNQNHHLLEIDVTGQRIRQMGLGLSYSFGRAGGPQPFIGLGWSCRMVLPFSIDYEFQHEANGMIEKGTYEVTGRSMQRNLATARTGLDMPLSNRLHLNLEADFYRQWKKTDSAAPDLFDIRLGILGFFK